MFPDDIEQLAQRTIAALVEDDRMIVTAESCTGGLIAAALTGVSGSSDAVHGGFVTYANRAKMEMLGVSRETLASRGAVSEQTARAMAEGARQAANVDIAIAVTGIAGPAGGSADKPVGLVHFGCATMTRTAHRRSVFDNDGRQGIRLATVRAALELVLETLQP